MLNITAVRRGRRQSLELNMAPLIDMVFILLIFFLVTTSFVKETGIDINSILFKFRGKLICSKNILLILLCFIFLKFKFFSFTTEFE